MGPKIPFPFPMFFFRSFNPAGERVEAFKDDAEAIKAIRLFPDVMMSFGGLGPDATDAEITQKFLPALKVMLPHGGYFHDTRTPVAHRTMDLATNTARAHSHHRTFRLPFHGLWFGLCTHCRPLLAEGS